MTISVSFRNLLAPRTSANRGRARFRFTKTGSSPTPVTIEPENGRSRRYRASKVHRLVTAAATLAALSAGGAGLLAVGAQAASADPYWVTLNAANSSLALDVSGGATWSGAGVIQWYDNGGANQHWHIVSPNGYGEIINQNSGLCLTTDGTAGDQLYQANCTSAYGQLWWTTNLFYSDWSITTDQFSGLYVDVYGDSQWAGAPIDGWYGNGQSNQTFTEIPA